MASCSPREDLALEGHLADVEAITQEVGERPAGEGKVAPYRSPRMPSSATFRIDFAFDDATLAAFAGCLEIAALRVGRIAGECRARDDWLATTC